MFFEINILILWNICFYYIFVYIYIQFRRQTVDITLASGRGYTGETNFWSRRRIKIFTAVCPRPITTSTVVQYRFMHKYRPLCWEMSTWLWALGAQIHSADARPNKIVWCYAIKNSGLCRNTGLCAGKWVRDCGLWEHKFIQQMHDQTK